MDPLHILDRAREFIERGEVLDINLDLTAGIRELFADEIDPSTGKPYVLSTTRAYAHDGPDTLVLTVKILRNKEAEVANATTSIFSQGTKAAKRT